MSAQTGQVLPKEVNIFVPKQTLDQVEAQLRAATAELDRQALAQSLAQETANSHRFAELAESVTGTELVIECNCRMKFKLCRDNRRGFGRDITVRADDAAAGVLRSCGAWL
ncbi:MAG: hypothetical protein HKL96_08135 [Phycisphaerales bacterium]|nr:hypothetical protein [Phycisphaerales bacterium]